MASIRQKPSTARPKRFAFATVADLVTNAPTQSRIPWIPERNLFVAVLKDALSEARKETRVGAEARAWIFDRSEPRFLFSFVGVCDVLGLNSDWLRTEVRSRWEKGEPILKQRLVDTQRARKTKVAA